MSNPRTKLQTSNLDAILNYVDSSKGLSYSSSEGSFVQITQKIDKKIFVFNSSEVLEVLHRSDSEGKSFLQINFNNSTKVLITEALIGFKPLEIFGLDMSRLPKVVTTPDLQSVFDAIEESLGSDTNDHEAEILKKVFQAILGGAEKAGFRLDSEKEWINRLAASSFKASA